MGTYTEDLQQVLEGVAPLISRALDVQDTDSEEEALQLVTNLKWDYARWFEQAKLFLPADLLQDFELQYDDIVGGHWRAAQFFENARMPSKVDMKYIPPDQRDQFSKWMADAKRTFITPIEMQKWLLIRAQARHDHGGEANKTLDSYTQLFRRLRRAARIAGKPYRENRPHFLFNDEYDLQQLLHIILTILSDDIEDEESSRKVLGSSPRLDFVLRDRAIAVEAKWVHESTTRKKLGTEIADDTLRYRRHPDVEGILFVIYDPNGLLNNPTGFENELCNTGREFPTRLVVVH